MSDLKIESAELRIVRLPLVTPFVISTGTMTHKEFPLLILRAGGIEGVAEAVMDPLPDYLEETIAGSLEFLRRVALPACVGRSFSSPQEVRQLLAPWRGHNMSKAVVEMAFWDLWAKHLNVPLRDVLGGTRNAVDVGVSLGIADIPTTLDRVAEAQAAGYKRIKLKIARGHDIDILDAVRTAYPNIKLTVDANTDYTLADMALLRQLDRFDLDYIEQPLAYDDISDHATLQRHMHTALCLDESIRTPVHARKALVMEAARVINIKVGRVGGHCEARAIHDLCAAFGAPVWCGGMLEAGIGRAHNLHLSSLPGFTKPGDTSSASRYFAADIINEPLEAKDGVMPVPMNGPGIGVSLDHKRLAEISTKIEIDL